MNSAVRAVHIQDETGRIRHLNRANESSKEVKLGKKSHRGPLGLSPLR
jgi:hypothetical protein